VASLLLGGLVVQCYLELDALLVYSASMQGNQVKLVTQVPATYVSKGDAPLMRPLCLRNDVAVTANRCLPMCDRSAIDAIQSQP